MTAFLSRLSDQVSSETGTPSAQYSLPTMAANDELLSHWIASYRAPYLALRKAPDASKAPRFMAVDHLVSRGFTRIGGLFKSDDMQGHLRYQGFSDAMQTHGLPVRDEAVCWFSTENKRRFLRDETGADFIRSLHNGVDAVVCYNDEIALELMEVLAEKHMV